MKRLEDQMNALREKLNASKERTAFLQTRQQAKETKQQQRKERRAEMEKNLPTEEKKKEWAQRSTVLNSLFRSFVSHSLRKLLHRRLSSLGKRRRLVRSLWLRRKRLQLSVPSRLSLDNGLRALLSSCLRS